MSEDSRDKINVLFDHEIFTRQRFGGISRYFRELIPRLSNDPALNINPYVGLHINDYGLVRSTGKYGAFFGFHLPNKKGYRALGKALNPVGLKLFANRVRPHIYHQTGYLDLLPGRSAKRVITLHDLIWNRHPELVRPGSHITPRKELILAADAVICISENTRQDAAELLGLPTERTTVIYHANSLLIPPREQSPCQFPYILFVGNRDGYKNFALLLKAISQNRRLATEIHLVTFGPAHTSTEAQLIDSFGLSGKVHAAVGSSDEVLATLYAHASAFVYPSLYEGFGIPLLEAMHYGCPVIAANASCFPEIAGGAAMLFDPKSVDDLAEKLELVVFNTHEAKRLRQAGLSREAEFSWNRSATQTGEFYRRIVG